MGFAVCLFLFFVFSGCVLSCDCHVVFCRVVIFLLCARRMWLYSFCYLQYCFFSYGSPNDFFSSPFLDDPMFFVFCGLRCCFFTFFFSVLCCFFAVVFVLRVVSFFF